MKKKIKKLISFIERKERYQLRQIKEAATGSVYITFFTATGDDVVVRISDHDQPWGGGFYNGAPAGNVDYDVVVSDFRKSAAAIWASKVSIKERKAAEAALREQEARQRREAADVYKDYASKAFKNVDAWEWLLARQNRWASYPAHTRRGMWRDVRYNARKAGVNARRVGYQGKGFGALVFWSPLNK